MLMLVKDQTVGNRLNFVERDAKFAHRIVGRQLRHGNIAIDKGVVGYEILQRLTTQHRIDIMDIGDVGYTQLAKNRITDI